MLLWFRTRAPFALPRCPVGRQSGNYPETGLEEINGNLLEADFWPGVISGLPVNREQSITPISRLVITNPGLYATFTSASTLLQTWKNWDT